VTDDHTDYDTGPFCCHFSDPCDCEDECPGCGHRCSRHAHGHDECGWPGCECESIADADDGEHDRFIAPPPPVPEGESIAIQAGETLTINARSDSFKRPLPDGVDLLAIDAGCVFVNRGDRVAYLEGSL